MELAAHWHRCQDLPKKTVATSLLYRERDGSVKNGLANWRIRSATPGSVEEKIKELGTNMDDFNPRAERLLSEKGETYADDKTHR